MSSPTIIVRALDANHDPMYGNGQADFLTGIFAVAQLIETNLLLFLGEWWNNLKAGLPLFQKILQPGVGRRPQVIALLIQQVILGVDGVTGINSVQLNYVSATREFTYSCNVTTIFGQITVNYQPGNLAVLPQSTS